MMRMRLFLISISPSETIRLTDTKVLQHWCNAHAVHHVSEAGYRKATVINPMFCATQVLHSGNRFLTLLGHIRAIIFDELDVRYEWPAAGVIDSNQRKLYFLPPFFSSHIKWVCWLASLESGPKS